MGEEPASSQAPAGAGSLDGRVAIVTGAAGGLGRSLVEVLRREGAQVLAVDLQELPGSEILRVDVGTVEGNREMVQAALDCFGRLDVLVLNAGVQHVASIADLAEEDWDRLHHVMVKGPFLAMREAWSALTCAPGGRIVVTASGSSYIAEKFKSAYVAAKHGVVGLVKVAALEGGPLGLTANAVAPGWMRTPMVEQQLAAQMRLHGRTRQEVIASFVTRHPVDRFVETGEVAEAVAFLASARSSGINGVCLPIDLGTLAW